MVLKDSSGGVGEDPSTIGRAGVSVRPPMVVDRSIIVTNLLRKWGG